MISSAAKESWDEIFKTYDIPADARVVPLGGDENRLFHISAPHRAPQVLRLSQPGADKKWIACELMVLRHIRETTELKVPAPIPDKDGRLNPAIYEPNQSKPTQVAMFTFVDGEILSKQDPSPEMMFRIGQTLAQLDLALKRADMELRPAPSKVRGSRNGQQIIEWALVPFRQSSADFGFLKEDRPGKSVPPQIAELSRRLRVHYRKLDPFLPKQLLHLDAHLENLVFDGAALGILDFNNMACGPRIYELAAPLHNIYDTNTPQNFSIRSGWFADLVEALIAGYRGQIPLSEMELKGFFLIQALRLFSGLGWAAGRQHLPGWRDWLTRYGASTAGHISALLDAYESSAVFPGLPVPRSWIDRAAQLFRTTLPLNRKGRFPD